MDKLYVIFVINLCLTSKIVSSQWGYQPSVQEDDEISDNQEHPRRHGGGTNPEPTLQADNLKQLSSRSNIQNNYEGEYYDDYDYYDDYYDPIPEVNEDRRTTTKSPPLSGNSDVQEDYEKQMHIELLKIQILHKLGFSEPPNITSTMDHLPEPILRQEVEIEQREYQIEQEYRNSSNKVTQITSFGTEVEECKNSHGHPSKCLQFELKQGIEPELLATAELWVYKLPMKHEPDRNHTFKLSLKRNPKHAKKCGFIESQEVNVTEGWIKFDVIHKVRHWLRASQQEHPLRILEISCKTCHPTKDVDLVQMVGNNKPFIMLTVKGPKHRQKRAFECGPRTVGCCRQFLKLNFTEHGWDFIKVPQVFIPYYCRGTCSILQDPGAISSGNIHSFLMQISGNPTCCAPKSMGHISVLYDDGAGHLIGRILENMIVEDCGCI